MPPPFVIVSSANPPVRGTTRMDGEEMGVRSRIASDSAVMCAAAMVSPERGRGRGEERDMEGVKG
jgi:hypothetical protein